MKTQTERNDILYLNFNSDNSLISMGSETGFSIFNTFPFSLRFARDFTDTESNGLGIVEILDRCNLIAHVGGGKVPMYPTNKVFIWDDKQGRNIAELAFSTEVMAVRLTREVIVVALMTKVYIYKFSDLSILHEFRIETVANPKGLLCVRTVEDKTLICCLGENIGEVKIFTYQQGLSPLMHNIRYSEGKSYHFLCS
eukprot:TRINITY_DN6655_c0_g1_i1.p1 TRINITY_DN6655_c0_g1~~TRINITY_DN6655_c0_g1_i1.p1  ORF type:complete len:197 (-),score=18.33 TRINITY_DN6655_c0_g1_i1:527-1117(-)